MWTKKKKNCTRQVVWEILFFLQLETLTNIRDHAKRLQEIHVDDLIKSSNVPFNHPRFLSSVYEYAITLTFIHSEHLLSCLIYYYYTIVADLNRFYRKVEKKKIAPIIAQSSSLYFGGVHHTKVSLRRLTVFKSFQLTALKFVNTHNRCQTSDGTNK